MTVGELKPGDRVTVYAGGYGPSKMRFSEVGAVGKRKITLVDGSEWTASGDQWGRARERFSRGPWIRPFKPEHEEQAAEQEREQKRMVLAHKLADVRWRDLPIETLQAAWDLVKPQDQGGAA